VLAGRVYQCYNIIEQARNFDKRRKTDVGLRPPLRNTDPRKTENATRPPHLPSFEQPKLCHRHINSLMQIAMNYGALFFSVALELKLDLNSFVLRFLDHTQLDTNSRYDCSGRVISTSQMPLPTQHQRKTRISMPLAEFEPVIPAILCLKRHRHLSCTALAYSRYGLCRLSFTVQCLNLYRIFIYI